MCRASANEKQRVLEIVTGSSTIKTTNGWCNGNHSKVDKEVNDPSLKSSGHYLFAIITSPQIITNETRIVNIDICISHPLPNETKLKLGLDSLIGLRKSISQTPCLGYFVQLAVLDALVYLKTMFKIQ